MTNLSSVHIGIDLDNTLIDYSPVFSSVGIELGLLPNHMGDANKASVRSFMRSKDTGEKDWMKLQGQVYGRYLEQANLMAGAQQTLLELRRRGLTVSIVSHKTQFGHYDEQKIDLRKAALQWLERHQVFADTGWGISQQNVHFLPTRDEKIARIREIGCTVFIDDLPEVLAHSNFPKGVCRIWFSRDIEEMQISGLRGYASWLDIRNHILRSLTKDRQE